MQVALSVSCMSMVREAGFFKMMVQEINRFPELWDHIGTVPMAAINKITQYFEDAKKKGLVRKDIDSRVMAVSYFSYLFRILVANAFLGDDLFMRGDRDDNMRQFAEIFVNGVSAGGE